MKPQTFRHPLAAIAENVIPQIVLERARARRTAKSIDELIAEADRALAAWKKASRK